jgi:CBS domain-containing protein
VSDRSNIVICPSCGHENIEGVDTCENCLMDLRTVDVPETSQVASDSDLLDILSGIRLSKAATLPISAKVRDAVDALQREPSGGLVVMDGLQIAGIFTERDVLKKVAGRPWLLDERVATCMTPDPVALRDSDTVATALNKMGDGGFRHIPVTRDGLLSAMVNGRDVLTWIMSRYFD